MPKTSSGGPNAAAYTRSHLRSRFVFSGTLLYVPCVHVYSRLVLNRGAIGSCGFWEGAFFGVGPNGPFFGFVNALINPPPALAWRSFLAILQENGFKKTPLGWVGFVVGWRWGSPEGTSGPYCAHELLHTNFVLYTSAVPIGLSYVEGAAG